METKRITTAFEKKIKKYLMVIDAISKTVALVALCAAFVALCVYVAYELFSLWKDGTCSHFFLFSGIAGLGVRLPISFILNNCFKHLKR